MYSAVAPIIGLKNCFSIIFFGLDNNPFLFQQFHYYNNNCGIIKIFASFSILLRLDFRPLERNPFRIFFCFNLMLQY